MKIKAMEQNTMMISVQCQAAFAQDIWSKYSWSFSQGKHVKLQHKEEEVSKRNVPSNLMPRITIHQKIQPLHVQLTMQHLSFSQIAVYKQELIREAMNDIKLLHNKNAEQGQQGIFSQKLWNVMPSKEIHYDQSIPPKQNMERVMNITALTKVAQYFTEQKLLQNILDHHLTTTNYEQQVHHMNRVINQNATIINNTIHQQENQKVMLTDHSHHSHHEQVTLQHQINKHADFRVEATESTQSKEQPPQIIHVDHEQRVERSNALQVNATSNDSTSNDSTSNDSSDNQSNDLEYSYTNHSVVQQEALEAHSNKPLLDSSEVMLTSEIERSRIIEDANENIEQPRSEAALVAQKILHSNVQMVWHDRVAVRHQQWTQVQQLAKAEALRNDAEQRKLQERAIERESKPITYHIKPINIDPQVSELSNASTSSIQLQRVMFNEIRALQQQFKITTIQKQHLQKLRVKDLAQKKIKRVEQKLSKDNIKLHYAEHTVTRKRGRPKKENGHLATQAVSQDVNPYINRKLASVIKQITVPGDKFTTITETMLYSTSRRTLLNKGSKNISVPHMISINERWIHNLEQKKQINLIHLIGQVISSSSSIKKPVNNRLVSVQNKVNRINNRLVSTIEHIKLQANENERQPLSRMKYVQYIDKIISSSIEVREKQQQQINTQENMNGIKRKFIDERLTEANKIVAKWQKKHHVVTSQVEQKLLLQLQEKVNRKLIVERNTISARRMDMTTVRLNEQLTLSNGKMIRITTLNDQLKQTYQHRQQEIGHTQLRRTESRHTESRNTELRHTQSRHTESRHTESRHTESRHTESRNTESRHTESRRTELRNTESRRTELRNTELRHTELRNTESRRTESRRTESRHTELRHTQSRHTLAQHTNVDKQALLESRVSLVDRKEHQRPATYTVQLRNGGLKTSAKRMNTIESLETINHSGAHIVNKHNNQQRLMNQNYRMIQVQESEGMSLEYMRQEKQSEQAYERSQVGKAFDLKRTELEKAQKHVRLQVKSAQQQSRKQYEQPIATMQTTIKKLEEQVKEQQQKLSAIQNPFTVKQLSKQIYTEINKQLKFDQQRRGR